MSRAKTMPPDECLWRAGSDAPTPQAPLAGTQECDVAIVGGGFTGLWTALSLRQLNPGLDVRLLEARYCGHGASGRNGGWLMGSVEGLNHFTAPGGKLSADVRETLVGLVVDAVMTLKTLGIGCDLTHGGGVFAAARYPRQLPRARRMLAELQALGFSDDDYRWLPANEAHQRVAVAGLSGAIYTPHVATLNPWKLVRGLKEAAVKLGIAVYEQSRVDRFELVSRSGHMPRFNSPLKPSSETSAQNPHNNPHKNPHKNPAQADAKRRHRLHTTNGDLTASWVVIATEGYSEPGSPLHPYLLPVQSGMVATEPLTTEQWKSLGFMEREAFSDFSRASTYLQRTADNRLVVGARGSYRLGRRCQHELAAPMQQTRQRLRLAKQLFPSLEDVPFTHAWSGTLGIPRRFAPHLMVDKDHRIATAGGYVGEGVGASFLFGRTTAELISGVDSPRTRMPWVTQGRLELRLRRWEPEPLPWLGFYATMAAFDLEELLLA